MEWKWGEEKLGEMNELAIIIPAFKEKYFHKALESLAIQTDKNFTVYIGDDCSPYNLKSIANEFSNTLDIRYSRFSNNIGSKDLVNQWKRCVDLSSGEEWIWLFSDDDIADGSCVDDFFNLLRKNGEKFDIYRFNTSIIDGQGKIISETVTGPIEERSEEMAYNLLLGKRGNSMPDHIFSRDIYVKSGGFVFTDYAQGSDWATSILFSKNKGLSIIPGSKLYWRMSDANISGTAPKEKTKMILGYLQFVEWLLHHFKYLKTNTSGISYEMIKDAIRLNLKTVIINHYKGLSAKNLLSVIIIMKRKIGLSYSQMFRDLFTIVKRTKIRTIFKSC